MIVILAQTFKFPNEVSHANGASHSLVTTVTPSREFYMHFKTILRSSLAVVTIATAVACADSASPTEPRSDAPPLPALSSTVQKQVTVATCTMQQDVSSTKQIGILGGTIRAGGATLVVPPGALLRPVSITAHAPASASATVQFEPEGLKFIVPAVLTMDYSKCKTPQLGVTIVYVRQGLIAEILPSRILSDVLKLVVAPVGHFSSYAVAY